MNIQRWALEVLRRVELAEGLVFGLAQNLGARGPRPFVVRVEDRRRRRGRRRPPTASRASAPPARIPARAASGCGSPARPTEETVAPSSESSACVTRPSSSAKRLPDSSKPNAAPASRLPIRRPRKRASGSRGCSDAVLQALGLRKRLELLERVVLDLADALARHAEGPADLLERARLAPERPKRSSITLRSRSGSEASAFSMSSRRSCTCAVSYGDSACSSSTSRRARTPLPRRSASSSETGCWAMRRMSRTSAVVNLELDGDLVGPRLAAQALHELALDVQRPCSASRPCARGCESCAPCRRLPASRPAGSTRSRR